MKDFNWLGFKLSKLSVCCKTIEEEMDFLIQCEKQGLLWCSGAKPTAHTYLKDEMLKVIYFDTSYSWYGGDVSLQFTRARDMKNVIRWQVEPKDLTWREVFTNIQEGEEYTLYNKFIKMVDGRLMFGDDTGCMSFSLDSKFTKKEQPKPVDFNEAFKAMKQGGIIQSIYSNYYYKLDVDSSLLQGQSKATITQYGSFEFEEIDDQWLIIK
ncbi:MAG: hypothetical protein ACLUSV_00340 [Streptococcus sp.]